MKLPKSVGPEPPPPRLSMSEYADWIEYMISTADPESIRRQKEFEEQIETPFRIAHAGVTAPGFSVGKNPVETTCSRPR